MALYRYIQYLQSSNDDAFNALHSPGTAAPLPGIYRCVACGDEIGIAKGHTLPPQTHAQHPSNADIKWQLIVYAQQK
ncbi:MAG: hypothetical protein DMF56_19245 [Acidobacteria bacterium]|nr:MAG: hypothetical protein DMF56_19245 [Acidobacteriota bacterium]